MFCTKCGTPNKYNATFCVSCGAPLNGAEDDGFDVPDINPAQAESRKSKKANPELYSRQLAEEEEESGGAFDNLLDKIINWLSDTAKGIKNWASGKPQEAKAAVKEKYEDIRSDDRKLKKLLAVILGIVLALLIIIFGSCACSSCKSCSSKGFTGIWVEASCAKDGYDSTDTIISFHEDGSIYCGKYCKGSYEYADGVLNVEYNGIQLTAAAQPSDENISLYLITASGEASTYAGMELYKLTSDVEVENSKLAGLYPNN